VTPHLDGGRGTFVLDRRLGKLGRLKVASGTSDREEFAALNAMVTRLKKERQWNVLSLLQRHEVSPLDLYDKIYRGETHLLPTADELRSLPHTIEHWLTSADLKDRTRADYRQRLVFAAGATIAKLPEILAARRAHAIQSGKRQTFNNLLGAVHSFLRDTLGRDHRLKRALPRQLSVIHREGNPQEPEQIRALGAHFPYPDELWALCLTGMRKGEYWGEWEVLSDRVRVGGTKTPSAQRVVPLVYRPARPRIAYSTFYKALVRESDSSLNVHDLRKTAQRWWEDAGVPDWRISFYAGHAHWRRDVDLKLKTIYRKPREFGRLLTEDAERIRAWLGDPPVPGLRAVSA
jgi:hypothetical protein